MRSILSRLATIAVIVAAITIGGTNRAIGSGAVVEIPFRQALGRSGKIPQIEVYPRVGFTVINFRSAFGQTKEKIRQVTIGDTELVNISSDDPSCISNIGTYSHGDRACHASLLYIEVDAAAMVDLPKTRMTVLTDNYLFLFDLIFKQHGEPKVVYLKPNSDSYTLREEAAIAQIEHLYLGYAAAIEKNIVSQSLSHKIHHFLYYVRAGKSISQAAAFAGVSMAVVRKLDTLGISEQASQQRSINSTTPSD